MWAHCSRSCSIFNIVFVFNILTPSVGEVVWRHTSHRDNEVTYRLVAHTLIIQFKEILAEHFNPYQFGITTYGGCEVVVHGIQTMLNFHPNWVVLHVDVCNTFALVSQLTISQELQFSPNYLDQLSHLFDNFMHAHYIFLRFFDMGVL